MQFKKGISFKQTGKHSIHEISELKSEVLLPSLWIYIINVSAHRSIFSLKPLQITEWHTSYFHSKEFEVRFQLEKQASLILSICNWNLTTLVRAKLSGKSWNGVEQLGQKKWKRYTLCSSLNSSSCHNAVTLL